MRQCRVWFSWRTGIIRPRNVTSPASPPGEDAPPRVCRPEEEPMVETDAINQAIRASRRANLEYNDTEHEGTMTMVGGASSSTSRANLEPTSTTRSTTPRPRSTTSPRSMSTTRSATPQPRSTTSPWSRTKERGIPTPDIPTVEAPCSKDEKSKKTRHEHDGQLASAENNKKKKKGEAPDDQPHGSQKTRQGGQTGGLKGGAK